MDTRQIIIIFIDTEPDQDMYSVSPTTVYVAVIGVGVLVVLIAAVF